MCWPLYTNMNSDEARDGAVLKLGTVDGFEVAFSMERQQTTLLGAALLNAPSETNPILVRRPE